MRQEAVQYVLERNVANDESATIVAIHATDGEYVEAGTHIVDVETSKVTEEILSPSTGVLRHSLEVGVKVDFGVVLFFVDPTPAADETPPDVSDEDSAEEITGVEVVNGGSTSNTQDDIHIQASKNDVQCLSKRARAMAAEYSVNLTSLPSGFVTVHDVRALIEAQSKPLAQESPTLPSHQVTPNSLDSVEGIALSATKRSEIDVLSNGAAKAGALSVIGLRLGPLQRRHRLEDSPFFKDRIVDLVIYEASRLMNKHPDLNASYLGNAQLVQHAEVNAGIAFDEGRRLCVCTVSNSDRKALGEIQSDIVRLLESYVENSLSRTDITGATFTVTDLSAFNTSFVQPLLPAGQSAIIAIGREENGDYSLYIGFDHRVSEGRTAAEFLSELASRLRSFASNQSLDPACDFCGKPLSQEISEGSRGLVRVLGRGGQENWTCSVCYGGW